MIIVSVLFLVLLFVVVLEMFYLVLDFAHVGHEVLAQLIVVFLGGHARFWVRDTTGEIGFHLNGCKNERLRTLPVVAVQRHGYTLSKQLFANQIDRTFKRSFVSHNFYPPVLITMIDSPAKIRRKVENTKTYCRNISQKMLTACRGYTFFRFGGVPYRSRRCAVSQAKMCRFSSEECRIADEEVPSIH
jgi:hypothetical protein